MGTRTVMATIRKRGGNWQVQVRRRGVTLSKTFINRSDAKRWANQTEAEADIRGLQPNGRSLERYTVADLITRFCEEIAPTRRGYLKELTILNALLRTDLAKLKIVDVTPEKLMAYCADRLQIVQPGTVLRDLGLLQYIFEVARLNWGIPIEPNPVKRIRKPKASPPRERRLAPGEWEKLSEACKPCRNKLLLPLVRFALATGMRRGELLNAKWREVNADAETLYIPQTKTGVPRTIPLSGIGKAVLIELAIGWQGHENIFPLTPEAVKLSWKRIVSRAGIAGLTFHDLRHEAISKFFEQGLSIPEVSLISGHKDPRMLFRYTHLRAEDVAKKLAGCTF